MTDLPPVRKRTGPAPSLPGRKPLTIHLSGDMLEALREASRRQGIGIGEYARRLIGKGLKDGGNGNSGNGGNGE
jgi:hypothetical protein